MHTDDTQSYALGAVMNYVDVQAGPSALAIERRLVFP
jgi:hypothetical protein